MVQWSNGPMVQWSNGPMVQWSNGRYFRYSRISNLQLKCVLKVKPSHAPLLCLSLSQSQRRTPARGGSHHFTEIGTRFFA